MATPSHLETPVPVQTPREGPREDHPHAPTRSIRSHLRHSWHALDADQRLAGLAAVALFLTMFLPWYSQTDTVVVGSGARSALASAQTTLSGFQAFSFVEAALVLLSASVLVMLYARTEGQPFKLPGGDGLIIMLAGAWATSLVFYRMLDTPSLHGSDRIAASVGVEWGIFVALVCAIVLALAGWRMRALREPAPPLLRPRESPPESGEPAAEDAPEPAPGAASLGDQPAAPSGETESLLARGRPRYPPAPAAPRVPSLGSAPTATLRASGYPDRGA